MYRIATVVFLAALSLGASPPPSETRQILASAAREMGRFAPGAVIELQGSITAEGRTGDYRERVRSSDGAFMSRARYASFSEADGFNGHLRWKQDRSGASHPLNAPFSRADAVTLAWLKRRGFLVAGSAKVRGLKHEIIGGSPATILSMQPPNGQPVDLAFDDASHLLVQVERVRPLSIIKESYSDYRQVGRFKAPFKVTIDDRGDIQHIHPVRYVTAKAASFSPPPNPRDTVLKTASILPLQAKGFAVVPATINGHQYDFILDTGGHNIVTPAIVAELGLIAEGSGTSGGSGPGRVPTSDTHISELKLGSATMTDQHFTVLDLGNAVKRKDKPPLAGILGLEIFERMAVTINEAGGTLTIEPFVAGRRCAGDKVPLLFDDDQPSAAGKIDGIPALIGIDVGNAGPPIVLWRWAEANRLAERFRQGKQGSGSGVGGSNITYLTPHHDIVVGKTVIHDVEVNYATTPTGYFSSRADSMNLGRTLLENHVVRFDYAQTHMCITPSVQ